MVIQSVITRWCASIQMIIIQMGHRVNNGPSYDSIHIDSLHTVCNHTLMCIHTDVNHADTATFPTKQKHTHTHIWKNVVKKKKKDYLSKKSIAKLRPHQMTGASQHASRAVTRARQNSNKQSSAYLSLFFFWMLSFCLRHCVLQNLFVFFLPPRRCFLSVIYSIMDTNNNFPWRNEM